MGRAMQDLDVWLEPFLAALGHKKRRTWAPLYLRGLLGPSERKSLQPMAASLGLTGHDQLQHFIASPAWDDAPLWRVLTEQADRLVGGPKAALVIDDTALPKKGTLSVGVPVTRLAKWKTLVQMVAIGFLLAGSAGDKIWSHTTQFGLTLLWIAAIFTLYTGYDYLMAALRHAMKEE